jgi:hypothetical protein
MFMHVILHSLRYNSAEKPSQASLVYSLACNNSSPTCSVLSNTHPCLRCCSGKEDLELYNDDGSNAYLSLVEVLVVSVVNGIRVDADLLAIFVMLLFQTYRSMM